VNKNYAHFIHILIRITKITSIPVENRLYALK